MAKVKIQYVKEPFTGFESFLIHLGLLVAGLITAGVIFFTGLAVYDTIEMHDKLLNKSDNIERQSTPSIPLPDTQGHVCTIDRAGNVYCK